MANNKTLALGRPVVNSMIAPLPDMSRVFLLDLPFVPHYVPASSLPDEHGTQIPAAPHPFVSSLFGQHSATWIYDSDSGLGGGRVGHILPSGAYFPQCAKTSA